MQKRTITLQFRIINYNQYVKIADADTLAYVSQMHDCTCSCALSAFIIIVIVIAIEAHTNTFNRMQCSVCSFAFSANVTKMYRKHDFL